MYSFLIHAPRPDEKRGKSPMAQGPGPERSISLMSLREIWSKVILYGRLFVSVRPNLQESSKECFLCKLSTAR